jgi:hypothetical protein
LQASVAAARQPDVGDETEAPEIFGNHRKNWFKFLAFLKLPHIRTLMIHVLVGRFSL